MVRHGESLGNVDATTYSHTPDSNVPLTELGREQARETGRSIAKLISEDDSILAFVSPYQRTQETFEEIQSQLGSRVKRVIHDPNVREQDFGNFQNPDAMNATLQERQKFGRFFYRFPHGESGADVYSRIETFFTSLFRHMDNQNRDHYGNILIVTHGIVMRVMLMRFLRWTVEEYERVYNPGNCVIWMLRQDPDDGQFYLCQEDEVRHISSPVAGINGERVGLDESLRKTHNRHGRSSVADAAWDYSPRSRASGFPQMSSSPSLRTVSSQQTRNSTRGAP